MLRSNIWEIYDNKQYFNGYKYIYDATDNKYTIANGGGNMYDHGNTVCTKSLFYNFYFVKFLLTYRLRRNIYSRLHSK